MFEKERQKRAKKIYVLTHFFLGQDPLFMGQRNALWGHLIKPLEVSVNQVLLKRFLDDRRKSFDCPRQAMKSGVSRLIV